MPPKHKAVESEGGNPDEIQISQETPSRKNQRRSGKGRRPEDDGGEDGQEEDSADGQDETDETDNSMSQATEKVKDSEETSVETENEKIDNGLRETCKSEPLKEDSSDQKPLEHAATVDHSQKDGEEGSQAEDGVAVGLNSESTPDAVKKQSEEFDLELKESQAESSSDEKKDSSATFTENVDEAAEPSRKLESSSEDQTDRIEKGAESEFAGKPESVEVEDKGEESAEPRESSTIEGGDQKMSADKEDKDEKSVTKEEAHSGKNLWVSGLSSSTRATDLKTLFSKHGKVVGAKVVTNARSPGARCYGFVTMSTTEEASKCVSHLHRTELHGRMISVEKAKSEPAGKKSDKESESSKDSRSHRSDRHHSADSRSSSRRDDSRRTDKRDDKDKKDKDKKDDHRRSDRTRSSKSGSRGTERTVVMDKSKGEPVISVKTKSKSRERTSNSSEKKSSSKDKSDILSFDKIKEIRERERQRQQEREIREIERRRERDRRERDRLRMIRERESREQLRRERERLELERQKLERERLERDRIERERIRIEHERKREQERILRERDELRRQQDQLRLEQDRRPVRRPYDADSRREETYWPEAKRMAMDDRYSHGSTEFSRPERFSDFDHRDRTTERREPPRVAVGDRENYGVDRHGRDGWASYNAEKRVNDRGVPPPPPPPRDGRDWGDHTQKLEGHQDRSWQGGMDGGMMGGDRGMPGQPGPGHVMNRGGMAGFGGYMQGGNPQGPPVNHPMMQGGGMQAGFDQDRMNRPNDPRFPRHF
ncbi:scaffold attachment factor B2-like isoform X2 [Protopterus annectens]|uniref:scaffold attachment factor B2-like isoform X2 n=1 Tax=Protopterus annectens TaxID=7888 RepID=UPI001CF9BB70|nr:scaffold attachment factor B2-like isoform X2 [Protopterus annectens]